MGGFLDRFRKNVISSVWKDEKNFPQKKDIDDKIALGVLLWVVASSDKKFLPQEETKIKEILISYSRISKEDLPVVLASIKAAAHQRIDLYHFTHQISEDLAYNIKVKILEELFRVACVDKDLDDSELEIIRKIAGLFNISHKDFIDTKIKVKKEFGLNTFEI